MPIMDKNHSLSPRNKYLVGAYQANK